MLFVPREKELWRRQFAADRCLHGITREPDSLHLLILPPLERGFLLMDKEAIQTPPSPLMPAFQAQAAGRDKKGVHSSFRAFPKSHKLYFCSHTIGQHVVT